MKHSIPSLALLTFVALAAGCATMQPQPAAPTVSSVTERSPGRVEQTNIVTAAAIVEHVDQRQRLVTLRMPDGTTTTLRAGDEVRNLAQVEKGDEVLVGYIESVAISVNKGEGELGAVAGEDVQRADLGEKPGGAAARTIRITAKIVAIDRDANEVTLEGKDGNRVTLDVRYPEHFDVIAVGDLVDIQYTEAIAVSVQPMRAD